MSALLNTLPGDIPGLLRRGSVVFYCESAPATVLVIREIRPGEAGASIALDGQNVLPDRCVDAEFRHLALDLSDPTGRAHAAWWVGARIDLTVWPIEPGSEDEARMLAQGGEDMTAEQIDLLARLVLRLAGRAS